MFGIYAEALARGAQEDQGGPELMASHETKGAPGNPLGEVASGLWVLAAVVGALLIMRGKGR